MTSEDEYYDLNALLDPDPWMLPPGEYVVAVGLFTRDENGKSLTVKRTEAHIQVQSKKEARYYFNQVSDMCRRAKKLEKAVGRLFK